MKILVIFLLLIGSQIVFAQDSPVSVLGQRWYEKTQISVSRENDQFGAAQSGISTDPRLVSTQQTISGAASEKFFIYEAVVKNVSNKKIIGVAWDYVFYESESGIEKSRKDFTYVKALKKNKIQNLIRKRTNPPQSILDVKDLEDEKKKILEKVEITCVVFEDRTTWKRPGIKEEVCENLRIEIKRYKDTYE